MTLHTDNSRQGAALTARRASNNPREIFVRLKEKHYPAKTKEEIFELWFATILKMSGDYRKMRDVDDDLLRAVALHTFTNYWASEYRLDNRTSPEERDAMTQAAKAKILSLLTLDYIMPNGLALRDCTGKQCVEMGGQFVALGKKIGKHKVGDVIKSDKALVKAIKKEKTA